MKAKTTWEEFQKIMGKPPLPPDHPVYSEPPSIMFLSRTSKQSEKKDTSSTPTGTPNSSPSSDVKPSQDSNRELGFMEQILANHPGLTEEEALEMIKAYGF